MRRVIIGICYSACNRCGEGGGAAEGLERRRAGARPPDRLTGFAKDERPAPALANGSRTGKLCQLLAMLLTAGNDPAGPNLFLLTNCLLTRKTSTYLCARPSRCDAAENHQAWMTRLPSWWSRVTPLSRALQPHQCWPRCATATRDSRSQLKYQPTRANRKC